MYIVESVKFKSYFYQRDKEDRNFFDFMLVKRRMFYRFIFAFYTSLMIDIDLSLTNCAQNACKKTSKFVWKIGFLRFCVTDN